jgi:hypothetical protein
MLVTDASIIRASTTKRYRVVRVEQRSKVQDEVMLVALEMTATMQGGQEEVVCCPFEDGMPGMAEKLDCGFYHGGITDERQRNYIYWSNRWSGGEVIDESLQ